MKTLQLSNSIRTDTSTKPIGFSLARGRLGGIRKFHSITFAATLATSRAKTDEINRIRNFGPETSFFRNFGEFRQNGAESKLLIG